MRRQHDMLESQSMGRRMHVWSFGHYGMPILVFPSAAGMAHEWDAHGMVDTLSDLIGAGKIKLYCTESNVSEAWTDKHADPRHKVYRHQCFERYISDELVPAIRSDCKSTDIPIATTGVSMGAYYAINFALKQPETFRWALCLSGRYDMTWLTEGYSNDDIYYNNPMAYVANLHGETLDRIRDNTEITLVCGRGPYEGGNIQDTENMSGLLSSKGVSNFCDMWGHDSAHEWPWWRRQALFHLQRRFG